MTQNWNITFDPLRLVDLKTDFDCLETDAKEQGEDIIQAETKAKPVKVLDLGWYQDCFRVMLIDGADWVTPLQNLKSDTLEQAMVDFIRILQSTGTAEQASASNGG